MKTFFIQLLFIFLFIISLSAQVYEKPAYGEKSHESLTIEKIIINSDNTIIFLSVKNKLEKNGWFCASNNISLKGDNSGNKYNLIKSEGIPICPNQHHFTNKNEILKFKLYFPSINVSDNKINLTENCEQACFFFKNIILDNTFNKKLIAFESGLEKISINEFEEAVQLFETVLQGENKIESHIYGLSYYYLILANKKLNKLEKVQYWHKKLLNATINDKETILQKIKELELIENY